MSQQFSTTIYAASTWVLPLLLAITLHEAAHGYVAHRFGDDTAWRLGRVSFNPLSHVDPFGTVLLPALLLVSHSPFLFGYAKPVPVNFRRLRNPRRDPGANGRSLRACLCQCRRRIISPTRLCGAWLAVALTVGEQWRVGRHSPTRCPVSFGLGFTPEDHGDPSMGATCTLINKT